MVLVRDTSRSELELAAKFSVALIWYRGMRIQIPLRQLLTRMELGDRGRGWGHGTHLRNS